MAPPERAYVRYLARRVSDVVPLTPLGLFVCAAAYVALTRFAFARADVVLLVIGYTVLAVVGLSLLVVLVAATWFRFRKAPPAPTEVLRTTTGVRVPTGFSVPSLWFLPFVRVRYELVPRFAKRRMIVSDRPVATARLERTSRRGRLWEEVTFEARGEVSGLRRRIVVEDVFGLARLGVYRDEPIALSISPHAGGLARLPMLTSLSGGDEQPHPLGMDDGDRIELRRYAPGDPARFIHWKIFARTRKLMVRMPERALSRSRRTVAYLCVGKSDEATAAAARVAVTGDAFGDEWSFGADGASDAVTRPDAAAELIVRSALARDRAGAGLASFLEREEKKGPASVVVFAPPEPGAALDAVIRAAKTRAHRMRVVIAIDSIAPPDRRSLLRQIVAPAPPRPGTPREALERVLSALSKTRCEVVLLERKSGRRLGAAHLAPVRAMERAA